MVMGKVVGHVVSTRKNENMVGSKILEIQLMENGQMTEKYLVAVDSVGAGIGEYVLVTQGSSARLALLNPNTPVDAVVRAADGCRRAGMRVRVERQVPEGVSFREIREVQG